MLKTIIHTAELSDTLRDKIYACTGGEFEHLDKCVIVHHKTAINRAELMHIAQQCSIDLNSVPEGFESAGVGLMISDMDSSMITIECVDEIADYMQLKEKVSAITKSAMRGEIDFETSLRRRVGLLEGLPSDVLDKVYAERLELSPGAEILLAGLQQRSVKTALVSGGFTYFTELLQQRLQLDFQLANTLEIHNDKLTGKVLGVVVTASRKASYLQEICEQLVITTQQVIAIGDGANDLEMLNVAGLGVAYCAKPVVQQQADVAINYSGLDAILDFFYVT